MDNNNSLITLVITYEDRRTREFSVHRMNAYHIMKEFNDLSSECIYIQDGLDGVLLYKRQMDSLRFVNFLVEQQETELVGTR